MSYTLDRRMSGRVLMGGLFIIIGTLLLLQKLDIIYLEELLGIRSIWSAWPIIFVVIGLGKLVDAPTMKKIGEGIWWIFLGGWLYVSINHIYGLSFRETWPAIIIAFGVNVLWDSFAKNSKVKAGGLQ
ncbi:MAG: DUF5668 domain-containing protein [Bacteroidota bacterium]|nr:DUF5668 domain-containing protein [Bacteroidota bacterium]